MKSFCRMLRVEHHILHLIDTLWLGGAQRVVKGLFENNREQKKLFLLALRPTAERITIDHPGVFISENTGKWNFKKPLKNALKLIEKHQIKTLHCHLPKSQLIGYLIKRWHYPHLKLIFHEQGDIMDPIAANGPGYRLARGKVDEVICCSHEVRNTLLRRTGLNPGKAGVAYNFVDQAHFRESGPQKPREVFQVGFAGRITARKGWRDLLRAMQLWRDEHRSDFVLHLAGSGPEEKRLHREIVRLGLTGNVKLYGFVKDMGEFYRQLDLLCVPSHWEPVGMVHLEAMSCGVPVIASDVPGLNEILQHEENCLLFPHKQPHSIKEAVERIWKNPELYKKLKNGGRLLAQKYDYPHYEAAINAVYKKLKV